MKILKISEIIFIANIFFIYKYCAFGK